MRRALAAIVMPYLLATQFIGCSTMFGRQHDEEMVSFDSNVPGVEVLCSGKRANAPGAIPLMQSKSHSCSATLEGYEKKIFRVRSGTSWAGFGHSTALNSALWGWWTLGIGTGIGWLIDFPSGAMRNLKETEFYVEMKPEGTTGMTGKIVDKTISIGKTIVNVPQDLAKDTASTILDATVRGPADQLGVGDAQRKEELVAKSDNKAKKV